MKPRSLMVGLALVGGMVGATLLAAPNTMFGRRGLDARLTADSIAHLETRLIDRDIEFFEARVERDPIGASDRASLAARYLQRARETGNYQDNLEAETSARQSLSLRNERNGATYGILAAALLAQHRFTDALAATHSLVEADSTALSSRARLGEVYLELGAYDSARAVFGELAMRRSLTVAPSLARWYELSGRLDQARAIFHDAARQAWADQSLRREQVAWFQLRAGELELKRGRLGEAERAFDRGLTVRPNDHRLLTAMARLELLKGRPNRAIELGERAIAVVLDPATLTVLAESYEALGQGEQAASYARGLETAIQGQPGAFHRAWSIFLLDHEARVSEVLRKAIAELETRRDVYGYDLLAWALYKSGRYSDARVAMEQALSLGTEDAVLYFHAGMIRRAIGDDGAARIQLERALALSPSFHPRYPRVARAVLDSLPR